jgi:Spy/CpxP family protein refolding chaperone
MKPKHSVMKAMPTKLQGGFESCQGELGMAQTFGGVAAFRFALVTALPLAFALTVGCDKGESSGGSAETPSSSTAAASVSASAAVTAAASSSAPAMKPAPMRRHAGLAGMLLRGAWELPSLTDVQREAIQKLEEPAAGDAGTEAPTPWAARKTFQTDLVAGIRATKLDTAKLQADYAALDKAAQATLTQEATALEGLHGVLDATQRQALVDQVKARRASHPPPALTAPDGGTPDWAKRRLDRYTAELALDDGQKKSVAALIAKEPTTPAALQARRDATQKRVDAMLAEFVKDPFSAKKLELSSPGKTAHDGEENQATFIAGLLPVLHPDQREKLAVRTERSTNRPMRNSDDAEQSMPFGLDDEGNVGPRLR